MVKFWIPSKFNDLRRNQNFQLKHLISAAVWITEFSCQHKSYLSVPRLIACDSIGAVPTIVQFIQCTFTLSGYCFYLSYRNLDFQFSYFYLFQHFPMHSDFYKKDMAPLLKSQPTLFTSLKRAITQYSMGNM